MKSVLFFICTVLAFNEIQARPCKNFLDWMQNKDCEINNISDFANMWHGFDPETQFVCQNPQIGGFMKFCTKGIECCYYGPLIIGQCFPLNSHLCAAVGGR